LIGLGLRCCSPRLVLHRGHDLAGSLDPRPIIVLAIAQMGVHLVFFLHITTAPDNTNNVMALAFGLLIVFLVIAARFGSWRTSTSTCCDGSDHEDAALGVAQASLPASDWFERWLDY